ncbi:MAG TPA: CYCXC family (seleno)protein [Candidatus Angelobacter sp.]|nr:CYCXC family (seleno)protein [Candidatus Angelobacter sp.]
MKTFLALVTLLCAAAITQAQWATQASQAAQVPAFHAAPPAKGDALPLVLTEKQLADQGMNQPVQVAAYKAVAKMPAVMYEQPCYCYCDRGHGHTSLHSCFESTHGANCSTCMGEALYSYQMSKKGWTPKMIRDGIIRGDWKMVDLQHPAPVN